MKYDAHLGTEVAHAQGFTNGTCRWQLLSWTMWKTQSH